MPDIEILDVMLGKYSRNEVDSQLSENDENMDQRTNERQTNTNPSGDDLRTFLNTNSVGNSDITPETVRIINSEITNQVFSKICEFNVDLNLHIRKTIVGYKFFLIERQLNKISQIKFCRHSEKH